MPERPVMVIKIGSASLVDDRQRIDLGFLDSVAEQIHVVQAMGRRPVIVSSGAVAAGRGLLHRDEPAASLPERQALAAIGQATLMHRWQVALAGHGLVGAQVLLTAEDFAHRQRYLNLTSAMRQCFTWDVVPIINENDTVATAELEISVGENDRLAALVAAQLGAEHLVLLTDIDGLYDADPRGNPRAALIERVASVDSELLRAAGHGGVLGTGGMRTKVEAARLAASAGVTTTIANARLDQVLPAVLRGASVGTRIEAAGNGRPTSRRRWLALARSTKGHVTVDAGAAKALLNQGKSLLPIGITAVIGSFDRGDTILIVDDHGEQIARGLTSLSSTELDQVKGQRMDRAAKMLGQALPKAAIHRDNLLLV